ncbi:transcriptional regulator with XRE-family HTH domain [Pedobacter cryoconitis]|uniref:Transcriptional regulator with XRE-family HTH domain n=1 Tax=Pedobacter cryoconitis TaxID=188932 RepID=A0A7W8YTS8_9SPHI|nr:helix-turn-helix transcriptional regulator [Pedobacter cryoconitis]MBB5621648.1 transcriptional regulator with XRE-family HTH domain [Pedobacter cryoconitis]
MIEMQIISKKIQYLRQQKRWNQSILAEKLKLSVPAVSKIETGMTDINMSRLMQIAEIFEVTLMELLSTDEQYMPSAAYQEAGAIRAKLMLREDEITQLQKKLIDLYEVCRKGLL